jgi:tetrapyrrole methylase family protein / MazG family protein
MNTVNNKINDLLRTITTLRSDNGCPWDRQQTKETLSKYIQEEVAELLEAIKKGDSEDICEESGDVLFLLIMLAEIHNEVDLYSFSDVMEVANEKLIRRHPHVFGDSKASSEEELRKQWAEIKASEKEGKNII